ncbi:solute carrier family 10 member 7 [Holotrichia oblita]|uniref:Solute carrier family 10 member 7 n=1 Tax=Holotrichia oblita TaxID=644536 RepID=A0ACB9SI65_HOLOL|nr:solute carrier family 10 member 7 [Holotrichia oblita]
MARKILFWNVIRKQWLLVGIVICIIFACIYPKLGSKEGPLLPEITVKYISVPVIFLVSGISLKTETLFYTFQQYKLHLFVQIFTFVCIPILMQFLVLFLRIFGVNVWILKGLITVACMPPPVSSAVLLTKSAQGNETAAIFNSVLGSFLGILITPISLLFNLGYTTLVPIFSTVFQLTVTVLFPLLLGQLLKKYTEIREHNLPLNTISQIALLFVVYTTFCDTFMTADIGLDAVDVLITVALVLFIHFILIVISFRCAWYFRNYFNASDVVAITFCSTHKSLTLGIPILRLMFQGYSHLHQISLPLMVYHPIQIILGGIMGIQMKDWIQKQSIRRLPI